MISAYALVFGGFLLLGGRAADLLGRSASSSRVDPLRRRLAPLRVRRGARRSLITSRAIQGLGAATISPAALSILTTMFAEGRERNIALGAWGAVGGFGAAAGVLFGGILTDLLSWNLDLLRQRPGLCRCAGADPRSCSWRAVMRTANSYDVPGSVFVTVRPHAHRPRRSRRARTGVGPPAGRSACSSSRRSCWRCFVAWEARHPEPLMPLSIFRLRTLAAANVSGFILGTALFAMFLMLTLYMQQVLHYSPLKTGVAYLAVAGTSIIWANVAAAGGEQSRCQAGARLRHDDDDRRPRLLHPGLRGRVVLGGPVPGLPDHRPRDSVRVHTDHDRRRGGHAARRGRSRVGVDQHDATDRRRPRHRGASTVANSATRSDTKAGVDIGHALTHGFQNAFWVGVGVAAAGVAVAVLFVRRSDLIPEAAPDAAVEAA